VRVTHSIENGSPWRGILAAAKGARSDAVFIGSHGRRGAARLLLGSVAERVVRESPVPVCVVKQDTKAGRLRRIGLATDLGPATEEAARLTRGLVVEQNAKLFVIHVVDREALPARGVRGRRLAVHAMHEKLGGGEGGAALLRGQLAKAGLEVKEVLSVGRAPEKLAAIARRRELDLLVMGTHARKGLERLFVGSVATQTIRLAPCPVLVVKPKA
jgi:nucleotide-binding universal stress UspA family protein